MKKLDDLLDLEEVEDNHYIGRGPAEGWKRVYGGQVVGQALVAASRTLPLENLDSKIKKRGERIAHSLHAYFLRAGDPKVPILYAVDRIRDGRSFNTRRVVAMQHGRAIFNMSISFQAREEGLSHQIEMPDVPPPEGLESERETRLRAAKDAGVEGPFLRTYQRAMPMELRPVPGPRGVRNDFAPEKWPARQIGWMKTSDPLPADVRIHQGALAYMSDWSLLDTCMLPHGRSFVDAKMQVASLDHVMWFHRSFRADEWLLYVQDSPSSSGGRGLNRGEIFNRQGDLVASVVQEGLIRSWD